MLFTIIGIMNTEYLLSHCYFVIMLTPSQKRKDFYVMSQFDGLKKSLSPFSLVKKNIDMQLSSIVCPIHHQTPTCILGEDGSLKISVCCAENDSEIKNILDRHLTK